MRKSFNLVKQPLVVMDAGIFIEEVYDFPGVITKKRTWNNWTYRSFKTYGFS